MPLLKQKPGFIPTAITIVAVVITAALGVWQMQRLSWKLDLIDRMAAQSDRAPVLLPDAIDVPEAWEYRRVFLTGYFDHQHETYLQAQNNAGRLGYNVITPLIRPEGSTVLVNRGWVPLDRRNPASRADGQAVGPQNVAGTVRLPWRRPWHIRAMMPPADLEQKIFYEADIGAMAAVHGLSALPVFIVADKTSTPGRWPQGGQAIVRVRNPHLGYALTWFSLSVTAIIIFVIYHRRKSREG